MDRALGDRVDSISVADLLEEIETLAVVRHSNHVNTLAFMIAKQERDEPVRQFAENLRDLAAVCDLTVNCTFQHKVFEVNKWVLMSLISGLNNKDTKQAVLSKVEEMTVDNTVAVVEARETGKNSVKILSGGGLSSGQANRLHEKAVAGDLGKCKYCGRKGNGKSPNFDLKKASCAAFDHKCKKCNRKGHFCTWKKDPKKEVSEDPKKTTASGNKVTVNRMEMTQTKVLGISHHHKRLMKNQQNMTKLRHETWCEKS